MISALQYHDPVILQAFFRAFQPGNKCFKLFFTSQTLTVTFKETKKGISEKRSRAVHPPVTRRLPKNRFPPKTVIRPPWRRIPMQTSCKPFILTRNSPDSVIPGQDRLCRREGSLPLSLLLYHGLNSKASGKQCPNKGKTVPVGIFSGMVKIAGQVSRPDNEKQDVHGQAGWRERQKPHPRRTRMRQEKRFPYFVCSGQVDSVHFGMRNAGIGICISSYIFMYCAKSR